MPIVPLATMPTAAPLTGTEIFYAQQAGLDTKVPASAFFTYTNVKYYGAVGDGVTNDTAAFVAASQAIQIANGGVLLIPPGTYIVGSQTFANGTGHGYSYLGQDIISLNGVSRPVSIQGYGATLKIASGLKFGSFDPTTGAIANPGFAISAITWANVSGGQITCTVSGSPTIAAGNTLTISGVTNSGVAGNAYVNAEYIVFSYSAPTLVLSAAAPVGFIGTLTGANAKINMINGYTVQDSAATVGNVISISNCTSAVSVLGLELDGNMANLNLGGQWGDTGWQQTAGGISLINNTGAVTLTDLNIHHHGQDGLYISNLVTELSNIVPHRLQNVASNFNARQALSWVGGNHLSITDCRMSNTGQGAFNSAPGDGIDLEPEFGSVCLNMEVQNSEFVNNAGYAIQASGDQVANVRVSRSKIIGLNALYMPSPRTAFEDCLIVGNCVQPYSSTTKPNYSTIFSNCIFSDEAVYGGVSFAGQAMLDFSSGTNVKVFGCQINVSQTKGPRMNGVYIKDTAFTISAGTGFIANNDFCLHLAGSILEDITIVDNITVNIPAGQYYVLLSLLPVTNIFRGHNNLISAGNKINWYGTGYLAGYLEWGGITAFASAGVMNASGLLKAAQSTRATAGPFTLSGLDLVGGTVMHILDLTGAISAATNVTLPTVSSFGNNLVSGLDGQTWLLRIRNTAGTGSGVWTVITNTGWSLSGTMTIAVGAYRDFLMTFTSTSSLTATLLSIGSGTN